VLAGAWWWQQATENARKARELFAQASRQFAAGKIDQAAATYLSATVLDGGYVDAHIALGNTRLALGRTSGAKQSYNEALELDPEAALALFSRGNLLWLTGDLADAAADLRQAADLRPGNRFFHDALAKVLLEKGDLAETEAMYRRAVDLNPEREWPLWGWLGMITGDPKRDGELLSTTAALIKDRPRSVAIAYYQGVVLQRRRAWRKAIKRFQAAIRLAPDAVPLQAYEYITKAYWEIGNRAACLRYAEQFKARIGFPLRAGTCLKK